MSKNQRKDKRFLLLAALLLLGGSLFIFSCTSTESVEPEAPPVEFAIQSAVPKLQIDAPELKGEAPDITPPTSESNGGPRLVFDQTFIDLGQQSQSSR